MNGTETDVEVLKPPPVIFIQSLIRGFDILSIDPQKIKKEKKFWTYILGVCIVIIKIPADSI